MVSTDSGNRLDAKRIVRRRQSCLAKTTRKRAGGARRAWGVAGMMKSTQTLPDDEGKVTTRTPDGNDQREAIQHNNSLRGATHKPHPKCHFDPALEHAETPSIIHLDSLFQRLHIKRHINIASGKSLGAYSIIGEALSSWSECELEGIRRFDELDFEAIAA